MVKKDDIRANLKRNSKKNRQWLPWLLGIATIACFAFAAYIWFQPRIASVILDKKVKTSQVELRKPTKKQENQKGKGADKTLKVPKRLANRLEGGGMTTREAKPGEFSYDGLDAHLLTSPADINRNLDNHSKKKLVMRASVWIPKQKGVQVPIQQTPIFEGITNEGLMYGAVTAKAHQMPGKGNYALYAHNMGDGKHFFSPLQNKIDVNSQPKAYVYSDHKLYTYVLNKKTEDKIQDRDPGAEDDTLPTGYQRVKWTEGRVIENDYSSQVHPALTLVTCEIHKYDAHNPMYRVVVRGTLKSVQPY